LNVAKYFRVDPVDVASKWSIVDFYDGQEYMQIQGAINRSANDPEAPKAGERLWKGPSGRQS
jgi:hypothetical protein